MLNWIVFIIAAIALLSISSISSAKLKKLKNDEEGFLLGGRSIGPFVGAMTLMAAGYSGWIFIGSSGTTYIYGTIEILAQFFFALAITFVTLFFSGFLRKRAEEYGGLTIPESISASHDGSEIMKRVVHFIAGAATFVFLSIFIIGQIRAVGYVASQWLNISEELAAILLILIIMIFTMQGGLLAIAFTDSFMAVGMLIGALIILGTIVSDVSIFELIRNVGEMNPELANPTTSAPYGDSRYGIYLMIPYTFLFATTLPYISVKFLGFKRDIKTHVAALYTIPVGIILTTIPLAGLYVFYKQPNLANPDTAMPVFLNTYLHPTVSSIITLFILFAMLSTIGAVIQSLSSALSHDMYISIAGKGKYKNPLIDRVAVIIVGIFAICLTFLAPDGLLGQIAIIGTGGLISMFVGPIIVSAFIKGDIKVCLISMIVGLVSNIIFTFASNLGWVEIPILAALCNSVVYFTMSFISNGYKLKPTNLKTENI